VGYLSQNQRLTALEMDELCYDYTKKAIRLKSRLELDSLFLRLFLQLSFGEQKRMCLAFLLRKNLDILIVDEPTNHADSYTKNLILNELKSFTGIGILVSHDRQLLNELAKKTVFLDNGCVRLFDASFTLATAEKQNFENHQKAARQNQMQTIKKQSRSLQLKSEKVSKKAKCLSKRAIAKKDHDQKEKINRAKLFGADNSDSRAKKVFKERLAKSVSKLSNFEVKKEYGLGAFFESCVLARPVFFKEQTVTKNNITIKFPAITLNPLKKGVKYLLDTEPLPLQKNF
jgi:macrolide transport system ATP-binding/permease protein